MPELPDITIYIEALEKRILNRTVRRIRISSPFLLRTASPTVKDVEGRHVVALQRMGKRICIGVEQDLWLVLHLMIAGRIHWKDGPVKPSRVHLAAFEFAHGTLTLSEAGTQKRAALHIVKGDSDLRKLDPGGVELSELTVERFSQILQSENHTLKRALTDPRALSGIGNAYSDEILWEAHLSPIALTQKLSSEEIDRLFNATKRTLREWTERLRDETGDKFPEKVTAFREGMAVHGRYKQPCPGCGAKVQRIRYATNETNYCPVCQTGGKLLADRALSRLLREDWPRTAEELG